MSYKIFSDSDVSQCLQMPKAIAAVMSAFQAKVSGKLIAPARHHVEFADKGSLVFTIGGSIGSSNLAGFRVYDTFKGDSPDRNQFVAVFDAETAAFKGIVIGELLGAMRTGAIGGAAIQLMARKNAQRVGIIGSGLQAKTQLLAAAAVRNLTTVKVFSRSPENRTKFAIEMSAKLELEVTSVDSAKEAVTNSDIVICATTSDRPVFDHSWLAPGSHVNTVGPKFKGRHELDPKVAETAKVIATDSPQQIKGYTKEFFLSGTADFDRIKDLTDFLVYPLERNDTDISLFCSAGLAGTEVFVAATLFE